MSYIQPAQLNQTQQQFEEARAAGVYLTFIEAAERLAAHLGRAHYARQNLNQAVKAGALDAILYGQDYYVTWDAILAWREGVRDG